MVSNIQQRGNGSYLLVCHIGCNQKGEKIRKTRIVRAKNIAEARKKLAIFVTGVK